MRVAQVVLRGPHPRVRRLGGAVVRRQAAERGADAALNGAVVGHGQHRLVNAQRLGLHGRDGQRGVCISGGYARGLFGAASTVPHTDMLGLGLHGRSGQRGEWMVWSTRKTRGSVECVLGVYLCLCGRDGQRGVTGYGMRGGPLARYVLCPPVGPHNVCGCTRYSELGRPLSAHQPTQAVTHVLSPAAPCPAGLPPA